MVLAKFAFREVLKRPGRALLTLLSIVIGVAAVVSVTVATSTTRQAYKEMFATITGRAALEVVAEGGGSFDQNVVAQLEQVRGVKAAVPTIQRPTIMYANGNRVKLLALGIDLARDKAVRDYELSEGRFLQQGKEILIEASFAKTVGVRAGDEVKMLTRRGLPRLQVVGLLLSRGNTSLRQGGLVYLPLAEAQSVFSAKGQIDTIQVVLEDSADEAQVQAEIAKRLPVGISVRPPAARTQSMEETLLASEQGLHLTSAFSLLLAAFIIFNTFLMNVGERRRQLAIMRAIGATRRQVARLIFGESLVMGCIGTLLGLLTGLLAAYLLTRSLERVLLVALPPIQLSAMPFVLAGVFGFGVSLLGAYIPARRASRLSPHEGMGVVVPGDVEGVSYKFLIVGTLLSLGSGSVLALSIAGRLAVDTAVVASVFLLLGVVLLLPAILSPLSSVVVLLLGIFSRVEARLAQRQILRHRARSTLTIGVLFVASSTGLGMASSILDNVRDVKNWYRQAIVGDFFVRAMMPDMATGLSADLPEGLGEEIRAIPGIRDIDTVRFVVARAEGQGVIVIIREFTAEDSIYFDVESGNPDTMRGQLFDGEVVIGSVLAQRAELKAGDRIELETREGTQQLRIAGVVNDYLVGGLTIHMERETAKRLLNVEGVDAYIIRADRQHLPAIGEQLQILCDEYGLLLHSFADISSMIDAMIRGIDACLWGLVMLGFVVAAFGVVNTLTMNVLEQTRELGLLRIVAMTRRQIRKTIMIQAAIICIIGVVPGVLAGVGVAYLINLATMPVTGHAIDFVFRPWLLVATFLAALIIVVAAAYFPAERAARLELGKALQYE